MPVKQTKRTTKKQTKPKRSTKASVRSSKLDDAKREAKHRQAEALQKRVNKLNQTKTKVSSKSDTDVDPRFHGPSDTTLSQQHLNVLRHFQRVLLEDISKFTRSQLLEYASRFLLSRQKAKEALENYCFYDNNSETCDPKYCARRGILLFNRCKAKSWDTMPFHVAYKKRNELIKNEITSIIRSWDKE